MPGTTLRARSGTLQVPSLYLAPLYEVLALYRLLCCEEGPTADSEAGPGSHNVAGVGGRRARGLPTRYTLQARTTDPYPPTDVPSTGTAHT